MINLKIFFYSFIIWITANSINILVVYPGIVIEQIESSSNYGGTIKTISYFSVNNMRTDDLENKTTAILLFGDDIGYLVSHKTKSYFKYKISERVKQLTKIEQQNFEKNSEDSTLNNKKVEIIKTNEKSVINGFSVIKIKVMAEDKLIEEDWVSSDIDMSEVKKIMEKMRKQYNVKQKSNNDEIKITKTIEDSGFLILSKRYSVFLGENVEDLIEVKKIEKRNLNNNIFIPPLEYKEVTSTQQ